MSNFMHAASVPVFRQMLGALKNVLDKGATFAAERKVEPAVLLQSRLFPDMFPLLRQVQIASDFAKGVAARLAGVEVPSWEDDEQSFDELRVRIDRTLAFIEGLAPSAFDGSETRDVVLRPGTPKERRLQGQAYLLAYGLPQFFFHVTTSYAILRSCGVEVGKRDFMGEY